MSKTPHTNKRASLPCPNSSSSFWHTQPNAFLLGHRTTADLPATTDIVIVGSGITGASIAQYLATSPSAAAAAGKALDVLLLEAREVCWGATGRNGGHCQPLVYDRDADVAGFEVKNVEAVKGLISELGVAEDVEWRDVTACRSFWDGESFEGAKRSIAALKGSHSDLGGRVRVIEGGDKGAKEEFRKHRVNPAVKGMTLTQGAGQLWPYKYVAAIMERLVKGGKVNLQTNTAVTGIVTGEGGGQIVKTPRGDVHAKHVILATNGYTSHLLGDFTDLIVPMRCEMSALHPPVGSERLPDSYGMMGFEEANVEHDDYLIQRPFYEVDGVRRGGHLMFGGGRSWAMYDCVGETEDDIVDPGEADYLRRALLRTLELGGETEGLKELKASHQWTGIKGYSRDNMPWVGKVPKQQAKEGEAVFENGLWLCGGYTGHGMPNATLCGKAVVDMVLAEMESKDKNPVNTYEATCKKLVKDKDLPETYVITTDRLSSAHGLPSVVEQDAAGSHGFARPKQRVLGAAGAKEKSGRCSVM